MLGKLRDKIKRRIRARERQRKLYRKTNKSGHGKAAKRHAKAVRKLRKILARKTDASNARLSPAGTKFVSDFEGYFSDPYNDPVGYATVGFGHLLGYRPVNAADRNGIWVPGQRKPGRLTVEEARELLARDISRDYAPTVRRLFIDGPLAGQFDQALFDALVSFAYNLGVGSVRPGTVGFETIGRAIERGDRKAIADAMLLYDKAGGIALPGLTRRRKAERRLILTGNYSTEF
jgi:GH24 family phage-related lysozyme (muramidase)